MKTSSFLLTILAFASMFDLSVGQEATATVESNEADAANEAIPEAVAADTEELELEETPKETESESEPTKEEEVEPEAPVQSGPFIDLFGQQLYGMELIDETSAQINSHYTNDILAGKKVIGIYFSADWCGPCRQFTPELVKFYERMNNRRGKKNQFEIVWVSRCRDVDSYVQYFAHMPWIALPPEEAMGQRGQWLSEKYKTKGIPHLVLLDDLGNTITIDARNKIPQDKAGIGFPWRSPLSQLYSTVVPRSLRLMVRSQIDGVKEKLVGKIKSLVGKRSATSPMGA